MHIGLIGGIGPAATMSYYGKLVRAFRQAGVPLSLTIAHADIDVLLANASADNRKDQAVVFAGHADRLAAGGCDVVTISALTGHFCFDATKDLSPVPLVSAIDPIDQYCATHDLQTIGLLGSPSVMRSHLFGQLNMTKTVVRDSALDDIGDAYLEMAMTGTCSAETRRYFLNQGAKLCTDHGADAVLMAGTDLGLAFDGQEPGYRVIDAVDVHVAHMVELARKYDRSDWGTASL